MAGPTESSKLKISDRIWCCNVIYKTVYISTKYEGTLGYCKLEFTMFIIVLFCKALRCGFLYKLGQFCCTIAHGKVKTSVDFHSACGYNCIFVENKY